MMIRKQYFGSASQSTRVLLSVLSFVALISNCSSSSSHSDGPEGQPAPVSEPSKTKPEVRVDSSELIPKMFIARVPLADLNKTSTNSVEFVGLAEPSKITKSTDVKSLFLKGEPMKLTNENGALVAAGKRFKLQMGMMDRVGEKSSVGKPQVVSPIVIESDRQNDKANNASLLRGNLFDLLFRVLGAQVAGTTNSVGNVLNFLTPYRSIGQLFSRFVSSESLVAQGYRYFPFTSTEAWGTDTTRP
jgi:hypothetical protein